MTIFVGMTNRGPASGPGRRVRRYRSFARFTPGLRRYITEMKDGPSFHTRHRVTREPLSEFHRTPLLPPVTAQSEGEVLPRLYPSPDLEARHLPRSRNQP